MKTEGNLNREYLLKVCCGDETLMHTLVDLWITEIPDQLENLGNCCSNEDLDQLGSAAHKLKSSVAMMGMSHTVGELERVERHAEELHASGALQDLIGQIVGSCTDMLENLKSGII